MTRVEPSATSLTLTVGQSQTLTARAVNGSGGTVGRKLFWASANPTIASVNQSGSVTAVAPGSTQIAVSAGGESAVIPVTISQRPVALVRVSPTSAQLKIGETVDLSAETVDAGGTVLVGRPIIWSSTNLAAATVTSSGKVIAVGAGSASITATSEGITGSAAVTVTQVAVASVRIEPNGGSLLISEKLQLAATPLDADGNSLSSRGITWITGAPNVATVSQTGLVTALAPGSAVIFAASEGASANVTVTVRSVSVASVTVSPNGSSIQQGQTLQLAATVRDAGGNVLTDRSVSWRSSNETVATVSSTGRVVAITPGSVSITATADGVDGQASFTVTRVPVAAISVSPKTATLSVPQTVPLTATLLDANQNPLSPTGRTITWSSANVGIATVNGSGVVTAVAAGSTQITATSEGKSDAATITVSQIAVASVSLTPSSANLNVGDQQPLTAVARDAGGNILTGRPVTWSSSNPAVATVSTSATGGTNTVTAVASGSSTISAVIGGVTGFSTISVSQVPVANVLVTPSNPNLVEGNSVSLTATPRDAVGNPLTGRTIVWSSSNPLVSVSQSGVVTAAINTGGQSATITATAANGGPGGTSPSGGATVTITFAPVASVQLAPGTGASVSVGNTITFAPTLLSASGQTLTSVGRTLTWSSQNTAIATVHPTTGVVTGVAPGGPINISLQANSPGQTGGPSGSAQITVNNVPVASVSVVPAAGANPGTVHVGTSYARKYRAIPRDAGGNPLSGRSIVWTVSDLSKAQPTQDVDSTFVTGVATTGAPISLTATSEGRSASIPITVDLVPVSSVAVSPGTATLIPHVSATPTVQLTATPRDSANNAIAGAALGGRTTTWGSSSGAATVSGSGLVTAVSAGAATITATIGGTPGTAGITVLATVASLTNTITPDSVIGPGPLNGTVIAFAGAGGTGGTLAGRTVALTSSNPAIATVAPASAVTNGSGQVSYTLTGVSAGTVTVTATAEGASQVSSTIRVMNPVTSVSVVATPADSIIGTGTANATATLRDAGSVALLNRAVAWSSSAPAVASVNSTTGLITALTAGSTTITATSEGVTGSIVFRVLAPVSTVTITAARDSIFGTSTLATTATLRDASNSVLTGRPISWSSSNTLIATVSNSGVITGVAPGTATITATVEGQTGTFVVRVLAGISTIALSPATDSIIGTGTLGLSALASSAAPAPLAGRVLSVSSSNASVATVSPASGTTSGAGTLAITVTGVSAGNALLTVSAEGQQATRTIRILAPVATVSIATPGDSIIGTGTLAATATLRDAASNVLSGRPTVWSSTNAGVATIDPNTGLVTAVSVGTTDITATSEGHTSTALTIRVLPAAASLVITTPDSSVTVGDALAATAEVRDAGNNILTGRVISWTSSAPAKATINAVGNPATITLIDSGSTTITASVEGLTASIPLTISLVPAATVAVVPPAPADSTGKTIGFSAVLRDASNNILSGRAVAWSSSDGAKLSIDPSTGVASLVDSGTVTVTATTTPGTGVGGVATGTATVTIHLTPVDSVLVPLPLPAVTVAATTVVTATVRDTRSNAARGRGCLVNSSDTNIVTASLGAANTNASGQITINLTGVALGTATVTITCEGKSTALTVTVT